MFQRDKILLAFSLLLLIASTLQIYRGVSTSSFVDYYAYVGAGKAFIRNENPYTQLYDNPIGKVDYLYPPGSLLFTSLFSFLEPKWGIPVFTVLSYIAFIVGIVLVLKLKDESIKPWKIVFITALLTQTFPLKLTLTLGQINNFVLLFISVGLFFLKKKRGVYASLCLAIAGTLKLIPLIVIPLFLMRREWKITFQTTLFFLLLNAIKPNLLLYYVANKAFSFFSFASGYADTYNQSLSTLMYRISGNPNSAAIAYCIAFLLFGNLLVAEKKTKLYLQPVSFIALFSILASSAWQHHLVWAYPFIIIYYLNPFIFIPIWALLLLHFNPDVGVSYPFSILLSYQTLLILILVTGRILKSKQTVV